MNRLRWLFFPLAAIYWLVVFIRNRLYDWGWFKSYPTPIKTICIGNLSVGGSGKTPHTTWLARHLSDQNPAILSRGYGRKSRGFRLYNDESTVQELGDEPMEQALKLPGVTIAVCEDRLNGLNQLDRLNPPPGIVLLDDAFQHRKVSPNLNLLLTPFQRPFFRDYPIPTGSLRDNRREAHRADAVIVTKTPRPWPQKEMDNIRSRLSPLDKPIFFSSLVYKRLLSLSGESLELSAIEDSEFLLVTAIADARPLVKFIESLTGKFKHLEYSDHYSFRARDVYRMKQIIDTFDHPKTPIVTTAKDAVKLEPLFKKEGMDTGLIWTVEIGIEFYEEQRFKRFIDGSVGKA